MYNSNKNMSALQNTKFLGDTLLIGKFGNTGFAIRPDRQASVQRLFIHVGMSSAGSYRLIPRAPSRVAFSTRRKTGP